MYLFACAITNSSYKQFENNELIQLENDVKKTPKRLSNKMNLLYRFYL